MVLQTECTFCRVCRSLVVALSLAAAGIFSPGQCLAQTAQPEAAASRLQVENPRRMLFVGNSYLYYGDSVHNHVRRIAVAAGLAGKNQLQYKSVTISGSALHDHTISAYLEPGKLRIKRPFEVVILKGGSAAPFSLKRRRLFLETVADFSRQIRATGGETALYMTHAYHAPHKRARPDAIADIASLYIDAANRTGALLIPVGLAFEEAYRQRPAIKLHQSFYGSHPSLIGTYLAACVVYASIYARSVTGNPYDYFGRIDKKDALFLQKVADKTVRRVLRRR